MEIKTLVEIKTELKRFEKRLDAAIERLKSESTSGYNISGTKETGAVRRAALDLKSELTKITNPL